MTEIKRYKVDGAWAADFWIEEHPNGEWVRWEDVTEILADLDDCREAIRHLTRPRTQSPGITGYNKE